MNLKNPAAILERILNLSKKNYALGTESNELAQGLQSSNLAKFDKSKVCKSKKSTSSKH